MDIRSALKSQYHAALETLREAIEKCPDSMWDEPADRSPAFWRVAYHTLFYHIQHHAAVLSNRLWRSDGILVDWVASG
jgi:hypothetical protein